MATRANLPAIHWSSNAHLWSLQCPHHRHHHHHHRQHHHHRHHHHHQQLHHCHALTSRWINIFDGDDDEWRKCLYNCDIISFFSTDPVSSPVLSSQSRHTKPLCLSYHHHQSHHHQQDPDALLNSQTTHKKLHFQNQYRSWCPPRHNIHMAESLTRSAPS